MILASGALAAVLALLAELAAAPGEAPHASNETPQQRAPNEPPPLRPVETFAVIAERPLFQPSRRPAIPPPPVPAPVPVAAVAVVAPVSPPPPPAPPPVLAPMTLLAVAISPDKREAVLGLPGGKSTTMAEGESVNGWVLAKVLPDRAVFRIADTEKEVTFPVAQTAAQPVPPHRMTNPSPPTQRPR
jgi:hypothetical protein